MIKIRNSLLAKGLTGSTAKTYCNILGHFFEHTGKVNNFTKQEISNYLEYLMIKRNYSARSRNLVMKVIRYYCREFCHTEIDLPKAKENKPIPKICDDSQFTQIMSVTNNPKHKLCLLLMRYSGLRRYEVIRVMKHHILSDGRLLVKQGKGQKDRYTIIPPQVKETLDPFVNLLPAHNQYIFQSQDGNSHYNLDTPQAILNNAFDSLGWSKEKHFGCHALRHAFAIWCLDELNIELDMLRFMLGHNSLKTTEIYLQHRRVNYQKILNRCNQVEIEI